MQQDPSDRQGQTRPAQQETEGGSVPRMPHERDDSADSQTGQQAGGNGVGRPAHDDAASGRQDTDKGPVMDQVYDRVRQGTPDSDRRR